MLDQALGVAFFLFFAIRLIAGAVGIVRPEAVARVRERLGASDASSFGGWFYATPWRTRGTGAALLAIAMLGLGHMRW